MMASSERPELMEEVRLSKNPREREKYDNLVSTLYILKFSKHNRNILNDMRKSQTEFLQTVCFHFRQSYLQSCPPFNV